MVNIFFFAGRGDESRRAYVSSACDEYNTRRHYIVAQS